MSSGCTYSLPYHALELDFSFFCEVGTSVYSPKPGGDHAWGVMYTAPVAKKTALNGATVELLGAACSPQ